MSLNFQIAISCQIHPDLRSNLGLRRVSTEIQARMRFMIRKGINTWPARCPVSTTLRSKTRPRKCFQNWHTYSDLLKKLWFKRNDFLENIYHKNKTILERFTLNSRLRMIIARKGSHNREDKAIHSQISGINIHIHRFRSTKTLMSQKWLNLKQERLQVKRSGDSERRRRTRTQTSQRHLWHLTFCFFHKRENFWGRSTQKCHWQKLEHWEEKFGGSSNKSSDWGTKTGTKRKEGSTNCSWTNTIHREVYWMERRPIASSFKRNNSDLFEFWLNWKA